MAKSSFPTGASTMSSAMSDAIRYRRYVFEKLKPFMGQRVWEIGCGRGEFTQLISDSGRNVLATDIDQMCIDRNRETIGSYGGRVEYALIDMNKQSTYRQMVFDYSPDTAIMINVIEHLKDDLDSVSNIYKVMPKGAVLVGQAPAHPFLFGSLDEQAGHFRRYTIKSITKTLKQCGWSRPKAWYINLPGVPAWYLNSRVFRSGLDSGIVNAQIRFFEPLLIASAKATDIIAKHLAGQSVLFIGIKEYLAIESAPKK